jgi:hypothetical protein
VDLSDETKFRIAVDNLQYITRILLPQKGLDRLWHKYSALEPTNVSRLLFSKPIINYIRKELRRSYKIRFDASEIKDVLRRIIEEEITPVDPLRTRKPRRRRSQKPTSERDTQPIEKGVVTP